VIRFTCENCGQKIKVHDQYAGKKGKCPKCRQPIVVPAAAQPPAEQSTIIKFRCPHCSQKIGLSRDYAGRQVRCAKCKQPFRVPQPSAAASGAVVAERPASPAAAPKAAGPPSIWDQLGGAEELRLAESSAPAVEGSLPFETPQRQRSSAEVSGAEQVAAYEGPMGGLGAGVYQGPVSEKPSIVNVGLFIGLGCAAAVAVAVVLLVVFMFGMAKSAIAGDVDAPEAQEIAEQFIYMLEDKKLAAAKELLAEDLQADLGEAEFERLAERMTAGEISELEYVRATAVENPDMEQFLVWYYLEYADGYANVIVSVLKGDEGVQIDGVGAMDASGDTTTIGSSSYDELAGKAAASAVSDAFGSANFSLPCIAWIILAIVGIVQVAAVWTIFDKAGEPGWAVLVPVYNMWVWAVVADKPGWWGLATFSAGFIPYVGWLVQLGLWIVITIGVAKAFNRGVGFGLGLCFLPIVFYPMLAFGSD
jgi:DNA-directed RNA polymerase subunit RPC12/RpoP